MPRKRVVTRRKTSTGRRASARAIRSKKYRPRKRR